MILFGMLLLGSGSLLEADLPTDVHDPQCCELFASEPQTEPLFAATLAPQDLDGLELVSLEDEFDLGFDTSEYLPEGFDPNKVYVNVDEFTLLPLEEEAEYIPGAALPQDFDAYTPFYDIMALSWIDLEELEEEESLDLGFDTTAYLPMDFDPYDREIVTVAQTHGEYTVIIRAHNPGSSK